MRARDKRTATENFRCWCFTSLEKKTQKNLRRLATTPPPFPLYVRGLIPTVKAYHLVDICDFQVGGGEGGYT